MKSNLENKSKLERKLSIEVPNDTVKKEFQKAYQEIQKQVKIDGFRKGKVPLNVIKQKYRDHVLQDVANQLVQDAFVEAIREHDLKPVAMPKIDIQTFNEEENFHFTAEVEIRPDIELTKIEGLKIQKEKIEVADDKVEQVVESMRESKAENVTVFEDRGVAEGDIALIDFDGYVDGEPLQGGKAEKHPLEVGSNQFIPGFEEQVIGMKPGQDRDINVSFPEEYHAPEIAGKPALFKIKLHEIQKRELPELTDEFAKSMGDYENLEDLKSKVRTMLTEQEEKRIFEDLKSRTLKALVQANPIEVPESQVLEQKELLLQDTQDKMSQQGMGEQQYQEYKEKWDADFTETADYLVKSGYLVNEIANKNKIEVTEEDRKNKLSSYAKDSGIEFNQLLQYYNKGEAMERLNYQLLEEKVIQSILDKAEIEEVSAEQLSTDRTNT